MASDCRTLPLIAVTGSSRPYIYDLPHMLSLPEGFEFRFRYQHRWVDPCVDEKIAKTPGFFVGKTLLVLFHSLETKRIIPVRKCTIISIENLGPQIFLRFRLGGFPKIERKKPESTDPQPVDDAVNTLAGAGRDYLRVSSSKLGDPLPEGQYFRFADRDENSLEWVNATNATDAALVWASLGSILRDEPTLSNIPLLYLLGFQRANGKFLKPKPLKQRFSVSNQPSSGFHLVEGTRYRLRVLEWCKVPHNMTMLGVPVECSFNDASLGLEGSRNLIVGRYDVLEYTFMGLRPGYTELAIRVEGLLEKEQGNMLLEQNPSDGQLGSIDSSRTTTGPAQQSVDTFRHEWPLIYSARVPVVVTHRWSRIIGMGTLGLVGLVMYFDLANRFQDFADLLKPVGILIAFIAVGDYLERFLKLNREISKYSMTEPPGKQKL